MNQPGAHVMTRERDRHSPWARVNWHMRAWHEWKAADRERGWPSCSHEERARQQALTPYRAPPGPRVPDYDHSRVGPMMDRLLADLRAEMGVWPYRALLVAELHGGRSTQFKAATFGRSAREYFRALKRGRHWMDAALQGRQRR